MTLLQGKFSIELHPVIHFPQVSEVASPLVMPQALALTPLLEHLPRVDTDVRWNQRDPILPPMFLDVLLVHPIRMLIEPQVQPRIVLKMLMR